MPRIVKRATFHSRENSQVGGDNTSESNALPTSSARRESDIGEPSWATRNKNDRVRRAALQMDWDSTLSVPDAKNQTPPRHPIENDSPPGGKSPQSDAPKAISTAFDGVANRDISPSRIRMPSSMPRLMTALVEHSESRYSSLPGSRSRTVLPREPMAIAEINDRNRARCLGGIVGRMQGFIQHWRPKFKNSAGRPDASN